MKLASLPARTALWLALLAVGVSVALTVLALSGEHDRGEAALAQRAARLARRLAVSLQAPLYSFDGITAGDVVTAELAAPAVLGVQVTGSGLDRTWLAGGGDGPLPAGPHLVTATATVMEPSGVPSPRPLATVRVVLSPHLLEAEWRDLALRRALETLALVAAIALASLAVLHRGVMRPLERVRAAMVSARQALARSPGEALPEADPVAGLPGAVPELLAMGADYRRLAEAVHQSRAALAAREADLRATLDSIGDGVVTTGVDGRVLALNPVAERLTGRAAAEAAGRPLDEVLAGGGAAGLLAGVLDRGETRAPAEPLRLRGRGGAERWVTVTASPVRRAGGEVGGAVVVLRDVTDQRALEDQVRQAQKLEAIGQLAGGVAHDFNNMLTPMLAYGQLIREAPEVSEEVRSHAEVVVETASRAAALTRQLLAFSRKGGRTVRPLDPGRLLEDTATLLRRTLDRVIEVRVEATAARTVAGDAALLQNALLNLALNARDAMPGGGVLRLSARDVDLGPEDCAVPGFRLAPGPHVELAVADTGLGMTPEVLARVFEPFFTTKETGKGTGLGLAAVYGTVNEHAGAVLVTSAPGQGSTFRLLLPAAAGPAAAQAAGAPRARRARRGRALVVEDEALIRQLVARHLAGLGLAVAEAADGEAALAALAGAPPFDLAILDLVLPRLSGRQVLEALRARQPDVPVLLTSGFARDERLADLLALPRVAFLEKPWRPSELLDAVERLLG